MITYHYKCETDKCDCEFEVEQSIKEKSFTHCPECENETLYRVIHTAIAFVKSGIDDKTTLGKLAEHNTAKMGKYELQEKREYQRQQIIQAKQAVQYEMAEKYGVNPIEFEKAKTPWYRKLGPEKIQKMTMQQKEKYVQTGKV